MTSEGPCRNEYEYECTSTCAHVMQIEVGAWWCVLWVGGGGGGGGDKDASARCDGAVCAELPLTVRSAVEYIQAD